MRLILSLIFVLMCAGLIFAEPLESGIIGATVVTAIAGLLKGLVPPEIIFGVLGFCLTRIAQAVLSVLETRKQTTAAKIFWFAMSKLFGKMVSLQNDMSWIGSVDEKTKRIEDLKKRFPILNISIPDGDPSRR
jgi:hypothetical protein